MLDALAKEMFEILKGSGRTLSLYDNHGNKVYEPTEARSMFAEPDKLMLAINDNGADSAVELNLSQDPDLARMGKIINTLRTVSTRYNMLFNVREYGRQLSPKDFAYKAERMEEGYRIISEAMWGSTKTSYQRIGSAKLIVRHSAPVQEVIGARGRNIHNLFVETATGERFRFPVIHLRGARAFAQHIAQGGTPHDGISEHIVGLSKEFHRLAEVSKHIHHNRNQLDESAQEVRNNIRERLVDIKYTLGKIGRPRGYQAFVETYDPLQEPLDETHGNELVTECDRLADLLGIDSNHALAENLMPVAHLTMGDHMVSNTPARSRIAFSSHQAANYFEETLAAEFGVSGSFVREDDSFVTEDQMVLELANEYFARTNEAVISEEPEDKFLAYAKNWTGKRLSAAGEPGMGPEVDKQAQQLSAGLKQLISGQLAVKPVSQGTPKFSNPQAASAYKLGMLLDPKAGLRNDALANYLGSLSDRLGHGESLSNNENFFVSRAVALVDKLTPKREGVDLLPETAELEEWFNNVVAQAQPVEEKDLSQDPAALADFNKQVGDTLKAVNTDDHASMVNGDDVDEAYYDIAHKVADMLKYSDQQYNLDHGDEQVEPTDWYQEIIDNWDAFTKLVDAHMGMNESEIDEMDRFSGEPEDNSVSSGAERKIWEVVDQEIGNAVEGLTPEQFDDQAQMVDFVEDKVWSALKGWWDPTGDLEDKRAWDYLYGNDGRVTQMIQHAVHDAFGGMGESVAEEDNSAGAGFDQLVADALGEHPEGVSAESALAKVMHQMSDEEIAAAGGEAEMLRQIKAERDDRIKNHARDHKTVDEDDAEPDANPSQDFIDDVVPQAPEPAAPEEPQGNPEDEALARLRKLSGL
jgi:hypothetical protein